MAHDTWESRDRPVLEAIGEADADGHALERESDLPSLTGLEQRDVDRALVALRDADTISGIDTTSHARGIRDAWRPHPARRSSSYR